jgi:hypothetical protein
MLILKTLPSSRSIPKKSSQSSLFEVGSFPGATIKTMEQHLADRHVKKKFYSFFFLIKYLL